MLTNKQRMISLISELSKLDLRGVLKNVTAPYRILQGETDIVTGTSGIVSFVDKTKNSCLTCKVIPNSAHLPGVNGMQAVFEEIRRVNTCGEQY